MKSHDHFLQLKLWTKIEPVEIVCVRRIVQFHKHPELLLVAPDFILRAKYALGDVEVHVRLRTDLERARLIDDFHVISVARFVAGDIEA